MERSKELLSELKTLSDKVFCALYGTLSGVTVLATGAIGMKLASAPELARAVAFIVALVLTGISVFEFFSNLHLRAHRESIEFAVKKLEKALQAKLHGRNEWI